MRCGAVLILSFICASVQGQQLLFENYSSEQGLSQNSCYTIAQDDNGFMWFGTQDGLNRYDGRQFLIFLPQNRIGKKLPSNYISSLYFDSTARLLWVGTIRGACIYLPGRDSLVSVSEMFPYARLLENISIKKITSFRRGEYWILTYNKGLIRLNTMNKTIQSYFDDDENRARISSITAHQGKIIVAVLQKLYTFPGTPGNTAPEPLMPDHIFPEVKELYSFKNRLWIGTLTEGCYYIEGQLDNSDNIHTFDANAGGIGCFTTDAAGNLWMGTRGNGIIRYDPLSQSIQTAAHNRYDTRSPGRNFVLSLFTDRQGLVWCGLSGSGVAKYDPLKYQFRTVSNKPINSGSLPDNMIFDIYKCRDGSYYVGTQNSGIAQWDTATDKFYTYPESSRYGALSNTIYDMTEDNNGKLWIASWGGLMELDLARKKLTFNEETNLITAKKLYGVIKLKNADSLFITGENGPVFFSLKDRKWMPCPPNLLQSNAFIGRYIYEDTDGIVWICTVGAGLVRYDYKKQSFDIIEPVRKYSIYARHLLADGNNFWIATDHGVLLYDKVNNKITTHITLNAPNKSNVCYAIQKDSQGFVWASTNNGLYKINPQTYALQNYDLGNGLSFLEYNTACALTETDGGLIFGGVGGITRFHPSALKGNNFSPNPLITGISVNDSDYTSGGTLNELQKLSLNHEQNFLTIHFAVNNFSNQNKNQFAYRLQGLNDNWTNAGPNNFANYTSLPPGDYVFEVKSANSDGIWSEGVTRVAITINPPWWQTWAFRIGAALLISILITIGVRRRISHIRNEADLKHKIAETEMMALRAQMNPHFIFNCINSIDGLIQQNDKYHATVYLNKFAKLIRNILDSSKQNIVTLSKDLETLQLYIDLEQFRNEDRFTMEINADPALLEENYRVPPLIVQPYVENAIMHGLRKRPDQAGVLKISVSKINDQLEYIIEDNGAGRKLDANGDANVNANKDTNRDSNKNANGHANGYASGNGNGKQSYGMQMSRDRVKLFNQEENASVEITDLYENGIPAGTRVKVYLKIQ